MRLELRKINSENNNPDSFVYKFSFFKYKASNKYK